MTDQEINRAIAEQLGWCIKACKCGDLDDAYWIPPGGKDCAFTNCGTTPPDYCNDLNAMHEAENSGITPANSEDYSCHLAIAMDEADDFLWAATARQRAEAFLLTVGKWKGEA